MESQKQCSKPPARNYWENLLTQAMNPIKLVFFEPKTMQLAD
jgi:hypothetical protein